MRSVWRRGDLCFSVDKTRLWHFDIAPLSEVWKESGNGRFNTFESAWKEAAGVGKFRRRMAAIVYKMLAKSFLLAEFSLTLVPFT